MCVCVCVNILSLWWPVLRLRCAAIAAAFLTGMLLLPTHAHTLPQCLLSVHSAATALKTSGWVTRSSDRTRHEGCRGESHGFLQDQLFKKLKRKNGFETRLPLKKDLF